MKIRWRVIDTSEGKRERTFKEFGDVIQWCSYRCNVITRKGIADNPVQALQHMVILEEAFLEGEWRSFLKDGE